MTELALIVGGVAIMVLALMEYLTAEEEDEEPRWMGCVSGPYVRTKRIGLKGRNW